MEWVEYIINHAIQNRPLSIMLAFFEKTSIFFSFYLEKELLAFSVIFHDCDPDVSTQKDK